MAGEPALHRIGGRLPPATTLPPPQSRRMDDAMPETTRLPASRPTGSTAAAGGPPAAWLLPLFWSGWTTAWTLTVLILPAYCSTNTKNMTTTASAASSNAVIGHGREVLTVADVFVINIVGVWAVLAATLWLVHLAGPGAGPGWG